MVAFSTAPLRLLARLGFVMAAGALGFGSGGVLEHFIWEMAEYVGRIYEEVKRRPGLA